MKYFIYPIIHRKKFLFALYLIKNQSSIVDLDIFGEFQWRNQISNSMSNFVLVREGEKGHRYHQTELWPSVILAF